jgi:MFS family permease
MMRTRMFKGNQNYWMAVVFFLMMIPPGMWGPSLSNILDATLGKDEAKWVIPAASILAPIVGIFSSLYFCALADRKIEAQRLLAYLALSGALFLWLAFSSLQWNWNPIFYFVFQGLNMLISAPMFSLITKIILVNIDKPERKFPIYSVFGTLGWLFAGLMVSYFEWDSSPESGRVGAYVRILMGTLCFMLPRTEPVESRFFGWKAALGLNALELLKNRQIAFFFLTSMLVTIPYGAFYLYAPKHLVLMGSTSPAAAMTLGQLVEIFAMLFLAVVGSRFRMQTFLMWSMLLGATRYLLFVFSVETNWILLLYLGLALHGPIYAFMSITGKLFIDRRVPSDMRGQAQALYSCFVTNIGGVAGGVFCGAWFNLCLGPGMNEFIFGWWSLFWLLLAAMILACLLFFFAGDLFFVSRTRNQNSPSNHQEGT